MTLLIQCPGCKQDNDISRVLPQPGARAEVMVCDHCQEAFSYQDDEVLFEGNGRGSEFRAIYHDPDGKPQVIRPGTSVEDTEDAMGFLFEHYVESGFATGGHIEAFVGGIGWVVCD